MTETRKIGGRTILAPETLSPQDIGQAVEHMLRQAEHLASDDPDDIDYSSLVIRARPAEPPVRGFVQLEFKVEVR